MSDKQSLEGKLRAASGNLYLNAGDQHYIIQGLSKGHGLVEKSGAFVSLSANGKVIAVRKGNTILYEGYADVSECQLEQMVDWAEHFASASTNPACTYVPPIPEALLVDKTHAKTPDNDTGSCEDYFLECEPFPFGD